MKIATICFPVKDGNIYLAIKKKKIGAGFLNGYGGKVEGGEDIVESACRECKEEAGIIVPPQNMELVGIIDFYEGSDYIFKCHIYFVTDWQGGFQETDEMSLAEVFPLNNIPYERMLAGDTLWLSLLCEGKKIKAKVGYKQGLGEIDTFDWEPL